MVLIRQINQQHDADRVSTIWALKLAIGIIAPISLIILGGAWGLLKNKLWGWWLAFLTDAGLFGISLYSMIDDGLKDIDWDMFGFTAVILALLVWLLVPGVRRCYWNHEPVSNAKLDSIDAAGIKA